MRKLIGLTGPSKFTNECIVMIEEFLKADFTLLYHNNKENLESWMDRCSAFVLAGGVDVHPSLYGSNIQNEANLSSFDFQRDIRELEIIEYATTKSKPLLGICRGHQIIGIHQGLGEDFEIDLTRSPVCHNPQRGGIAVTKYETMHYIDILNPTELPIKDAQERSTVRKILVKETDNKIAWVNSFHHQGIKYNKARKYEQEKIKVLATAPTFWDKEKNTKMHAIEAMKGETWLSVQWHPEFDWDVNSASSTVLDLFSKMLGK